MVIMMYMHCFDMNLCGSVDALRREPRVLTLVPGWDHSLPSLRPQQ